MANMRHESSKSNETFMAMKNYWGISPAMFSIYFSIKKKINYCIFIVEYSFVTP